MRRPRRQNGAQRSIQLELVGHHCGIVGAGAFDPVALGGRHGCLQRNRIGQLKQPADRISGDLPQGFQRIIVLIVIVDGLGPGQAVGGHGLVHIDL